jgi:hypothetical protein
MTQYRSFSHMFCRSHWNINTQFDILSITHGGCYGRSSIRYSPQKIALIFGTTQIYVITSRYVFEVKKSLTSVRLNSSWSSAAPTFSFLKDLREWSKDANQSGVAFLLAHTCKHSTGQTKIAEWTRGQVIICNGHALDTTQCICAAAYLYDNRTSSKFHEGHTETKFQNSTFSRRTRWLWASSATFRRDEYK